MRRFLDQGAGLVHLDQGHVRAAGDVDEDAGGAVDLHVLEERAFHRGPRGDQRPGLSVRRPGPHQRHAHVAHDRAHVGEIDVDQARDGDQIGDALHGVEQHLVCLLEGVEQRGALVGDREQALVGDGDQGVDGILELGDPVVGLLQPPLALEQERFGHHPDGQRPDAASDVRDDGRAARTGTAAHARGDEDHVCSLQRRGELLAVLERGLAADLRVGAGTEPLGHHRAELDLGRGAVVMQRLAVGVRGDEIDAGQPGEDHRVERISAAAADTDHLDFRAELVRHLVHDPSGHQNSSLTQLRNLSRIDAPSPAPRYARFSLPCLAP